MGRLRTGLLVVDPLAYPLSRSASSLSALCSAHGTAVCCFCHRSTICMAAGSSYSAFLTTKNRASLITRDKIGGELSASRQLSTLRPSTAIAQISALLYLSVRYRWFSNLTQNSRHARSRCLSSHDCSASSTSYSLGCGSGCYTSCHSLVHFCCYCAVN